jgi:hypothetical protein
VIYEQCHSCTQEQINELVCYIVNGKLIVKDALKKANISYKTGRKYHQQYENNSNSDTHILRQQPGDAIVILWFGSSRY